MIGLGRMGASMVRRLMKNGQACVVHDTQPAALSGTHYIDVGTSGGVAGEARGYCLMIGGEDAIVAHLEPIFAALAPGVGAAARTRGRDGTASHAEQGFLHCGPTGAGHFVKMVHNGIEYGVMAAYAEGLEILCHADIGLRTQASDAETTPLRDPEFYQYQLDLPEIAGRSLAPAAAASRIPAKAAGPFRRRSTRRCPRRSSPRPCTNVSPRAAKRALPTACCRRCATSSAVTLKYRKRLPNESGNAIATDRRARTLGRAGDLRFHRRSGQQEDLSGTLCHGQEGRARRCRSSAWPHRPGTPTSGTATCATASSRTLRSTTRPHSSA